jgi:hypothetical protein
MAAADPDAPEAPTAEDTGAEAAAAKAEDGKE